MIQNEINNALVFHLLQHEQLYQILKCLNNVPNTPTDECQEYIDGIIEVHYPIPLEQNLSFTFYDTPGTDSNSNEHLLVLRKALHQQTNSILVILYEPTKMEGTGNSILYKLINSSRESAETRDKVHIDLSRSLHIINQADTRSLADLSNLKDKKVEISLKETDKIYNEKNEYIDLMMVHREYTYYVLNGKYVDKYGYATKNMKFSSSSVDGLDDSLNNLNSNVDDLTASINYLDVCIKNNITITINSFDSVT